MSEIFARRNGVEAAIEDPRLGEIARQYLRELEAGNEPRRQDYLAIHPDLQEALLDCLDAVELAHALNAQPHLDGCRSLPRPISEGEPLGDFRIVREIARGGMGLVYEAVQLSLNRSVALKVLPLASALDSRQLQRFKLEAQAAALLHHPNIVPVYGVGCERGVHFYAMQLIDGQTLASWIENRRSERSPDDGEPGPNTTVVQESLPAAEPGSGPILAYRRGPCRDIAEKFLAIVEAVEFAHASGVIHCDLKPGNILLDSEQNVWITDFGLASISDSSAMIEAGEPMGTLRYMSPERLSGEVSQADPRLDIYSLGATLYEWLTTQAVFEGGDRETLLERILNEEPIRMRQIDPSIPAELETITHKALSRNPADRYGSARAFAEDLRRFLDEKPIRARPVKWRIPLRNWGRRYPGAVAASIGILILLLAGMTFATVTVSHRQFRTHAALKQEQVRASEAEQRFQMAQGTVDDLVALAQNEASEGPFHNDLRTMLLQTALAHYQRVMETPTASAQDHAILAATQERIRKILSDLAALRVHRHFLLRAERGACKIPASPTQGMCKSVSFPLR